jgi:hypothetical protein
MAAAYVKAMAAVPETFRAALRDSQRGFMASVEPSCRVAGAPVGRLVPDCVAVRFRDRKGQFDPAVVLNRRAGFTFLTLANYRAIPASTKSPEDDLPEADILTVFSLQIAQPAGPTEQRWNTMIMERLDRFQRQEHAFGPGAGNVSFEIDLEGVAPGFIDSSIAVAFTPAQGRRVGSHWSLTMGRELMADDLFANPQGAFALLADYGLDEMMRAGDGKPPNRARMRKEILDAAAQPSNWAIGREGFTVCLEDFGAHGERVTAPWSKLRPFLKHELPFDPATLQ